MRCQWEEGLFAYARRQHVTVLVQLLGGRGMRCAPPVQVSAGYVCWSAGALVAGRSRAAQITATAKATP